MDELIAWAQVPIPASVFAGQTHEEWFPLSGKQGEGQEGAINLVLSYSVSYAIVIYSSHWWPYSNNSLLQTAPVSYGIAAAPPVMMVPRTGAGLLGYGAYAPVPVYQAPYPPPQAAPQISAEDLKMVRIVLRYILF